MPVYDDVVKPVCEKVKQLIEAKGFTVVYGRLERLGNEFPYATIVPVDYGLEDAAMRGGTRLHVITRLEILVLLKLLNPKVWFEDTSESLLDVCDALLADRTLSGLCYRSLPVSAKPDRITTGDRTYYGGVVSFTAWSDYTVT